MEHKRCKTNYKSSSLQLAKVHEPQHGNYRCKTAFNKSQQGNYRGKTTLSEPQQGSDRGKTAFREPQQGNYRGKTTFSEPQHGNYRCKTAFSKSGPSFHVSLFIPLCHILSPKYQPCWIDNLVISSQLDGR